METIDNQLDLMMDIMQRVEQDLRDYRWMTETVAEATNYEELKKQYPREVWEKVIGAPTAQYGIEATLPKAKGANSDVTFREAHKLMRNWERVKRYEDKIKRIEQAVTGLEDERERAVAEGLMDGNRLFMIAQQIDVSRQTVHEIKKSMIRKLALELYGEELKEVT